MATVAPPASSLEAEAKLLLPRLRSALARVLAAVPEAGMRPATVSRALGLHKTLAWKLVQIVENPDPFATVQHVPGDGGAEIVLRAAAARGVPEALVHELRTAIADLQRLVEAHAGDRASFELMIAGLARQAVPPVEIGVRKAGYRCASYVWGVQCRARVKAVFLRQGSTPDRVDIASVRGFVGLRRLRARTPWTLSRRRYMDQAGNLLTAEATPIDPEIGPEEAPLIRGFCSEPLPEIARSVLPNGQVEFRLTAGPVGDRAAVTCVFGDVMRDAGSRWATPTDRWFSNGLQVRTPTELLLLDTFVHRDLWPSVRPEARVYSELSDVPWFSPDKPADDLLPFPERVEHLGSGAGAAYHGDFPPYPELVEWALGKLGWRPEEFELYRLRVPFPVLRTAVAATFERPAPEG